jgi:4,5-DOPA dioxygenase extradiol
MPTSTQPDRTPAVFLSHGSPSVAIEQGPYQDALATFGRKMQPAVILAISAHSSSSSAVSIGAAEQCRAVHDFGGFPRPLYELTYAPPGSPATAKAVAALLKAQSWPTVLADNGELDHGVWVPLRLMYPEARIPVVTLAVPPHFDPQQLYQLGQTLAPLRSENVLILGSGGIVHNLRMFRGGPVEQPVAPWAKEFDDWIAQKLEEGDVASLLRYEELAPHAALAVPSFDHFAPLFPVLGAAAGYTRVETIFEGFQYGSVSMRSFAIA